MKCYQSIVKNDIREMLTEKVFPAVKAKLTARSKTKPILNQYENADPHLELDDLMLRDVAARCGLDIRIAPQPPSSPDLNALDLGFFPSIRSL